MPSTYTTFSRALDLVATFGVNKFLVTYPAIVKQQFPLHVPRTTVYGRLIGHHTIVNMDVSLDFDDKVCGGTLFLERGMVRTIPACSPY